MIWCCDARGSGVAGPASAIAPSAARRSRHALTVAERVTMMHDGRVIVEGTPDEIRANQTVHDLYLGRGHGT